MKAIDDFTKATKGLNKKINTLIDGEVQYKPLHQSNKLTHRIFGQDQPTLDQQNPTLSFQYYVNIKYNANLREYVNSALDDESMSKTDSYIKNVKLPDVKIDTTTMNEYNRKRLNHQKIDFSPVTVTFHDVTNGNTKKLWQLYYQYYFADGRFDKSDSIKEQKINPEHYEYGDFGYDTDLIGEHKHLLREIEIYQVSAKSYNKVTLYNPRIVEYASDDLSSDSSDLVEIRYTFEYEWAVFNTVGFSERDEENNTDTNSVLRDYFEMSSVLDFVEWTEDEIEKGPKSKIEKIMEAKKKAEALKKDVEGAIDAVKDVGRNIASRANQLKTFVNKIETEVLGRSEPRNKLPGARDIVPYIEKVPSNYPDVIRNVRRNRGNSPFTGADNDGQLQWPGKPNPSRPGGP